MKKNPEEAHAKTRKELLAEQTKLQSRPNFFREIKDIVQPNHPNPPQLRIQARQNDIIETVLALLRNILL